MAISRKKFERKLGYGRYIIKDQDNLKHILMTLKRSVKYLDFHCDFQKSKCATTRYYHERYGNQFKPKGGLYECGCCCSHCAAANGYLDDVFESHVEFYCKSFAPKRGYYRPGKGCILPHELRSITCLFYSCMSHLEEIANQKGDEINLVSERHHLSELRAVASDLNRLARENYLNDRH